MIRKIHKAIPGIVKRLSITAFTIASSIGGYGLVAEDKTFTKIGGICMIISAGLPPLFGIKPPKDESKDS